MTPDLAALATSLHWLRPHWLWALLALPLLLWWWRARQRRHSVWRESVDPHLLAHLLDGKSGMRRRGALWLGAIGYALAICALAGPGWHQVEQPLWQTRAPLVIALDLSTATLANDLQPSRLLQARTAIRQLLQTRAGGQVGLVAYADDAFTVAPLTDDVANVALFVDALSPQVMPVDGSRSDRAIAWSVRLLRQAGFDRGDIVLVTNHAGAAARGEAADAARGGFRVSALGLGTAAGAAYRNGDGRIARTRLDATSLQALTTSGGGDYAALVGGGRGLAALDVLDPRQAGTMAAHGATTSVWRDEGYWLLLPLMLLAVFAFRRGGALGALLLCLLLPWQPARAADDLWKRPDQQAHARALDATQAYRSEDFARAAQAWNTVPGADADYNRGNALAKAGDYEAAISAYDAALRQQPDMADAIANRKAVLAAMKRKPPSGSKQGDKGKQGGQGKPGEQGAQGKPKDSPGQDPAQQPGQSDGDATSPQDESTPSPQQGKPQDNGDAGKASTQPADAEAQRAADAAQRERMQRALAQSQSGKAGEDAAKAQQVRDETPEERERRLANEAWLKRVPDDPGGLLRAKFRLEYERRQEIGSP